MNRISWLLALGLLAAPDPDARAAGDDQPRVLAQTTYAIVVGAPRAEEIAGRVAALIDEAVPRIAPLVGTSDLRPVPAHLYVDRRQFTRAAAVPRQSTLVGLATVPPGIIHIDGTGLLASIEKVVPHEVGHIMVGRAVGPALPALPRWLNEGIAEYVAGERAAQVDPVALRAIGRGRALDLENLDRALQADSAGAALAYAQSASLVNFLVAERGEPVIAAILQSFRATPDFGAALTQATGLRAGELEAAWRRSVARRWRWPLLLQSPVLPLGLMLLLFLAGLVRYLVERRRRQELPEDDW